MTDTLKSRRVARCIWGRFSSVGGRWPACAKCNLAKGTD
jgi:hypothetical protein